MTSSRGAASHNSAQRRQASAQTAQLRPHSADSRAIKSTPVAQSVAQSSSALICGALPYSPPSLRQCASVMRHIVRHSVQASMQGFMFIAVLQPVGDRSFQLAPTICDGLALRAGSETTQSEFALLRADSNVRAFARLRRRYSIETSKFSARKLN
jgi:hypothetical protein